MAGVQDLESVQNVDFFSIIGKKLRKTCSNMEMGALASKFAEFD